jgi:hypothetical protein
MYHFKEFYVLKYPIAPIGHVAVIKTATVV